MTREIDILFVHSNASATIYQGLANQHSAIEPPIWAAMLANSVRHAGFSTAIVDAEAERLNYVQTAKKIVEIPARVICFVVYGQQPSASSQNMVGACATANLVREHLPDSFLVFVGGHIAALPTETLEKEAQISAVCQNEGVYTLRELLTIDSFGDHDLRKVRGLAFRNEEGHIEVNAPSQIVPNDMLETDLPGMAWDLLPAFSNYRTAGWHSWSNNSIKEPFAALYTTLGCPYRCSFCMINIINRTQSGPNISSADSNLYRRWSPEFVIKQFDYFANSGVRNIKIADELFVLNPNHFGTICKIIVERGYDFNIWAYSRVDTCKPQYLDLLRDAGVRWLGLGIENPNEVMRREIHKDGYHDVRIVDLIGMIRAAGINVGGNYIFGLPNDTMESMAATLDFAMENLTDMANFYCAMAYPGSPLHLDARRKGIALPSTYEGYSQHSYETLNLSNDAVTAAEILRFRDDAWMKYHTNPSYLALLEEKFGAVARHDLEQTTKIKLRRSLLETFP
jgi:anaerobic magnesium-protoporphyrin IX monomethyl ester cyclase